MLSLAKRERKVSSGQAWRFLELGGVRTYVILLCMKLMKGDRDM
jgi:hypothetical protein